MDHVSVDLWAANLELPLPDLATWLHRVEVRLADAAARGCQILVLPEFACAQWLTFSPVDLPAAHQLAWLAEVGVTARQTLMALSATYGVTLLPGTIPEPTTTAEGAPGLFNRAWLLTPEISVIDWNGLRIAMPICLDAEFTALWSRLGELDLDLILIPAKTDMITGFNRVFGCARARAIELQTPVCVVGAVGAPLGHPATDTGVGGAAVYLPCDVSVSQDGVFAALLPQPAVARSDPIVHAA